MIFYNISKVKYQFVARFSICNVLNKVEDKQIMINNLNHTSLESLFHEKGGGAVYDRHKKSICSKRRSYQY